MKSIYKFLFCLFLCVCIIIKSMHHHLHCCQEAERLEFSDQDGNPLSGSTDQLSDFDRGQIEMARRLGQSVSKTASLVGCSRSAVISIYQKRRRKGLPVKLCTKHTDVFTEEQTTKLMKKASKLKSKRKTAV